VLSAGHGSALLYALLHLWGYDLPLAELRRFRQLGAAGHRSPISAGVRPPPDRWAGVWPTPWAWPSARRTSPRATGGHGVFRHHTFVLASDGDVMEGSAEPRRWRSPQRLGRLVVLYDDNHVSLSGAASITFTRTWCALCACGWHVERVADGNDLPRSGAMIAGVDETERPSLIAVRPCSGTGRRTRRDLRGARVAARARTAATKRNLGWPPTRILRSRPGRRALPDGGGRGVSAGGLARAVRLRERPPRPTPARSSAGSRRASRMGGPITAGFPGRREK
jgi:transketolase